LTNDEQGEWDRVLLARFDFTAEAHKRRCLIDGSWIQDACDDLVTEMMRKYNKEKLLF
jgi:proline dehydrogenase